MKKENKPINEPFFDINTSPPDRSKESHEDAVKRYLSQIPKNETDEERMRRVWVLIKKAAHKRKRL